MKSNSVTYGRLKKAAKIGDWYFVDNNLSVELANKYLNCVFSDLFDTDDDVRDLVAIIFFVSDKPIDTRVCLMLESRLLSDEYSIVRYRIAMGLYKRGYRSCLVKSAVEFATTDPDVGCLAREVMSDVRTK